MPNIVSSLVSLLLDLEKNFNLLLVNIKQDFAESFSLSFHPLLIPFYSLMFVFVLPIFEVQALGLSFQISILVITALSTIILPLASMFILRNQNSISSFAIPERKERSKPYIFTMIFFGITAYMLGRISFIPSIIPLVLFIPVLSIFTLLLINSGKFGPPYLGKVTAAATRTALLSPVQVHAGSFRVSVIHRILTRTTGSLTYMRDHSYACAV